MTVLTAYQPPKEIADEPSDDAQPIIVEDDDPDAGLADDEESFIVGAEGEGDASAEPIAFPDDWPRPAPKVQKSIDAAAVAAGVPRPLAYALVYKESRFNPRMKGYKHGGNSAGFLKSYEAYKDRKIPGSSRTWGEMFPRPSDWTPYSLTQTLPFNAVGSGKPVKAGESLSAMFDATRNARAGMQLLATHYEKHGDWFKALRAYNGAGSYARQVLAYAKLLGWEPEAPAAVGEYLEDAGVGEEGEE